MLDLSEYPDRIAALRHKRNDAQHELADAQAALEREEARLRQDVAADPSNTNETLRRAAFAEARAMDPECSRAIRELARQQAILQEVDVELERTCNEFTVARLQWQRETTILQSTAL